MMAILSSLILIVLLLCALALRRKETITIDGYRISLWRDRDFMWIVYREPSGRKLTLEGHPEGRDSSKLLVDFTSGITFYETDRSSPKGHPVKLDVPNTPSVPIGKEEADRVRERISQGLTRLKIQHEFVRPMRSGWTSFEDGKEIYHG